MKLVALCCSDEELFPTIYFRDGVNVIFARVRDFEAKNRDNHNLGKTFLISVIDFCMLGGIDKAHPFRKTPDIFGHLTFWITVQSNEGRFVTVERSVEGRGVVRIAAHDAFRSDLSRAGEDEFAYSKLSVDKAKSILNGYIGLRATEPYEFRKGLSYLSLIHI